MFEFSVAFVAAVVAFVAGVYVGDRFLPVTALVDKAKKVAAAVRD